MQTRRDQLQAYRFQNRRALAALVTGDPNVLEPPMRRLTVTTISGIMIAILIAVGFALSGVFKPTTGDKWKEAGAIVVERETGARYVYLHDVLHPVINYSSAVLAIGSQQNPHVVLVDRGDIKDAKRGATIGIDGIPDSLPSASSLVTSPWTVCSRLQAAQANELVARTSVLVGDDGGARPLTGDDGVMVKDVGGGDSYLLYHGQRLDVRPGIISTSLGLQNAPVVRVGKAFLNAIPAGPAFKAPTVPDQRASFGTSIGGKSALVGQLLHVTDNDQYFLVLPDGVAPVNRVEREILQTLPIGPGGHPLDPIDTNESTAIALPQSSKDWQQVAAQFAGLPSAIPRIPATASDHGGVCAVFRKGATTPSFAVPASRLPSFAATSTATESTQSTRGVADEVDLAPGSAAVVKSGNGSATVFVVADPGRKFAVASKGVLSGFGYGDVDPVTLPVQLLPLIPTGPALDPTAALSPVTG